MYVLDENGQVVFEFSSESGGHALASTKEVQAKAYALVKSAVLFLFDHVINNGGSG
jgi:hypothetical protein